MLTSAWTTPPKILVGLHSEASPDERQVADSEGQVCDRLRAVPRVFAPHEWHASSQAVAAELGMSFMEASAKTGHNLHHVFCSLAAAALDLKCVGAALFAYDCFTLFPAPIQIRGGRYVNPSDQAGHLRVRSSRAGCRRSRSAGC